MLTKSADFTACTSLFVSLSGSADSLSRAESLASDGVSCHIVNAVLEHTYQYVGLTLRCAFFFARL
jgi:hypothetical protein